jgi:uncharacterized membrane protein YjjP (DUF1212 family)
MPDLEEVRDEFNRLDSKDKRWILVLLFVAAAALISAALGGSLLGDLIAFVVTFAAGWIVHSQWHAIRTARTTRSTPLARTRRAASHRKSRTTTRSKAH